MHVGNHEKLFYVFLLHVLLPFHLFNQLSSSACWFSMSCLRPHFGDVECFVWVVNIYHTHTWCCKYYRASVIVVIRMTITSVVLVARNCRSMTLSACCLDGSRCLVVKSCWVCVHKVIHVRSHSFTHLFILSKPFQLEHPPTVGPPLRCTAQSQPSVIMYSYLELHKAWGCLPGNLHCAILESNQLTVTQNSREVSQQVILNFISRNQIHQTSI